MGRPERPFLAPARAADCLSSALSKAGRNCRVTTGRHGCGPTRRPGNSQPHTLHVAMVTSWSRHLRSTWKHRAYSSRSCRAYTELHLCSSKHQLPKHISAPRSISLSPTVTLCRRASVSWLPLLVASAAGRYHSPALRQGPRVVASLTASMKSCLPMGEFCVQRGG